MVYYLHDPRRYDKSRISVLPDRNTGKKLNILWKKKVIIFYRCSAIETKFVVLAFAIRRFLVMMTIIVHDSVHKHHLNQFGAVKGSLTSYSLDDFDPFPVIWVHSVLVCN